MDVENPAETPSRIDVSVGKNEVSGDDATSCEGKSQGGVV
jgi:hypothetical protein